MLNEPILIIDDNLLNLKLLKRLLEIEEYQPLTAKNAQETLVLLERFHPKLILVDGQLPAVSGVELTRQIKSNPQNKDIIIVMVSSYDQKGEEQKARDAGCDGYVVKPIDTQSLLELVANFLKRKTPDHSSLSQNQKNG